MPLPAADMSREDWRGLITGFVKFVREEMQEPEHAEDDMATAPNSALPAAAGTMIMDPAYHVLFVQRSKKVDKPGSWCFPGGGLEAGESPADCAARETKEEVGHDCALDSLKGLDRREVDGVDFATYHTICNRFKPQLSDECTAARWVPWGAWPQPLHPGVAATLESIEDDLGVAEDAEFKRNPDGSYQPTVALKNYLRETDKEIHKANMPHIHAHPGPFKTGGEAADIKPQVAMDPLTKKGSEIMAAMKEQYGKEKGEEVFYASKNKGNISGVDCAYKDTRFKGATDWAMALDRSSARAYDADGRMHVDLSHISKATINPYYGREIPDYEKLGLIPDKKYMLLRDPEELAKGARTFNNLPILIKHVPVTAEEHQPELVVGSTGTDSKFKYPYLNNSLVLWAKPAIDGVEDNDKRQLSAAYRYVADMTPGTFEGQRYDGVMRNIVGNHVALVKEGRAGADVVVGDEMPRPLWRDKAWEPSMYKGARWTHQLAMDSKLFGKLKPAKDAGTHEWAVKAAATRRAGGFGGQSKTSIQGGSSGHHESAMQYHQGQASRHAAAGNQAKAVAHNRAASYHKHALGNFNTSAYEKSAKMAEHFSKQAEK